jgi:hypothetical protein
MFGFIRYIPLIILLFSLALQPSACYVLLVHGVSWSHNDAPQSVGLLWTSDHLVAETSTWQHTTHTVDKHPCSRWDFFFVLLPYLFVSCTLCSTVDFFSIYEKSDGFGRERTRDLGFQRPARKPLDHRSRLDSNPRSQQTSSRRPMP